MVIFHPFSLVFLFGRYFGRQGSIIIIYLNFFLFCFGVCVFFITVLQSSFPNDFILFGPSGFIAGGYSLSRLGQSPCVRQTSIALARGIIPHSTPNLQIRNIHTLVRVGPLGVLSQATNKAKGHMACTDLTVEEIKVISAGGSVIKDDVLIATTKTEVDGIPTLYVSAKNLNDKSEEQFCVNELVTCVEKKCSNKSITDAWLNLQNIHKKLLKNGGPL